MRIFIVTLGIFLSIQVSNQPKTSSFIDDECDWVLLKFVLCGLHQTEFRAFKVHVLISDSFKDWGLYAENLTM